MSEVKAKEFMKTDKERKGEEREGKGMREENEGRKKWMKGRGEKDGRRREGRR